jgi:hypothetical protein
MAVDNDQGTIMTLKERSMAGNQVAATTAFLDGFRALIRMPLDDHLIRQVIATAGPRRIKAAVNAGDRGGLISALQCYFTKRTALAIGRRDLAADVVRGAMKASGIRSYLDALVSAERGNAAALMQSLSQAGAELPSSRFTYALPQTAESQPSLVLQFGEDRRHPRAHAEKMRPDRSQSTRPMNPSEHFLGPRPARSRRPAPVAVASASTTSESSPQGSEFGAGRPKPSQPPRRFQTVHVYNQVSTGKTVTARAAACFELTTREADDQTGEVRPALKIEMTGKHPTLPNRYDWDNKLVFYLTEDELPQLLCVFLNLLPAVEFGHHGPQRNKSMKLQHQGKHLYLSMSEGSERKVAVQLDVGRSTRVAALTARAFQAANDGIDWATARDILMQVTAPMAGAHCSAKDPEPSACAGQPLL